MKWVTRKNANVDRVACPWLIHRFVDPEAQFIFVSPAEVQEVARREGAIPFDVPGAELGHVDGRCSFESIILRYGLQEDPALVHLAQIVHGADIPQDLSETPEAAGLRAAAYGFALVHGDDDAAKIQAETPLYDALYRWCQQRVQRA